jgi:hypothetical protein
LASRLSNGVAAKSLFALFLRLISGAGVFQVDLESSHPIRHLVYKITFIILNSPLG